MLTVQPIATYREREGYIVYGDDGNALCLIRRHPGSPVDLERAIGPHVRLSLMLTVSAHQWGTLALHMPGVEALPHADR